MAGGCLCWLCGGSRGGAGGWCCLELEMVMLVVWRELGWCWWMVLSVSSNGFVGCVAGAGVVLVNGAVWY